MDLLLISSELAGIRSAEARVQAVQRSRLFQIHQFAL